MIRPTLYFMTYELLLLTGLIRVTKVFVDLGMPLSEDYAAAAAFAFLGLTLFGVIFFVSTFRTRWICVACSKHYRAEYIRDANLPP